MNIIIIIIIIIIIAISCAYPNIGHYAMCNREKMETL